VSVTLNQGGEVIAARVIEGGDEMMREEALKAARASLFNIDPSAPASHKGTITYTFIPQ
jgi:TonB family protein